MMKKIFVLTLVLACLCGSMAFGMKRMKFPGAIVKSHPIKSAGKYGMDKLSPLPKAITGVGDGVQVALPEAVRALSVSNLSSRTFHVKVTNNTNSAPLDPPFGQNGIDLSSGTIVGTNLLSPIVCKIELSAPDVPSIKIAEKVSNIFKEQYKIPDDFSLDLGMYLSWTVDNNQTLIPTFVWWIELNDQDEEVVGTSLQGSRSLGYDVLWDADLAVPPLKLGYKYLLIVFNTVNHTNQPTGWQDLDGCPYGYTVFRILNRPPNNEAAEISVNIDSNQLLAP